MRKHTKNIILALGLIGIFFSCGHSKQELPQILDITDTATYYTLPPSDKCEAEQADTNRDWHIFMAIVEVESGCDSLAVRKNGKYIGAAQIGTAMVDEANRIKGSHTFSYRDRLSLVCSFRIFQTIMDAKNPSYDIKECCRIWNPKAGSWYYEYVLNIYNAIMEEQA